jgi:RNA recognition motif-containing protein
MQSRSSSPGQRRRRGGRSRNSSSSRQRSGDNFHVHREPRKPETFWDKVKKFFGLAPEPSKASTNGHDRPARNRYEEADSNEPREAREPRERSPRAQREPREPREQREPREPREPRKPEAVEVSTPRLYLGNLSYDAAESDLFELFSGVGTVANVEIIANKHTQRSKGFGFVQMGSVTEAKRAVDELHDKEYMGRKLVVSGAKLPPERSIGRDRDAGEETAQESGSDENPPTSQA